MYVHRMAKGKAVDVIKKRKGIVEYIYIDERRLNAYFEQFSDPTKYDRVPVWKVVLGLTGPKAEGTQIRPGREYTKEEKIQLLYDHLNKNQLVVSHTCKSAAQVSDPDVPFGVDIVKAKRLHISAKKEEGIHGGLSLWFEEPTQSELLKYREQQRALLYFIEDTRGDEHLYWSSWSCFTSLLFFLTADRSHPVTEWAPSSQLVNDIQDFVIANIPEVERSSNEWLRHDPVALLKGYDAQIGPLRQIRVVYRIRFIGQETIPAIPPNHLGQGRLDAMYCYPIVIEAA